MGRLFNRNFPELFPKRLPFFLLLTMASFCFLLFASQHNPTNASIPAYPMLLGAGGARNLSSEPNAIGIMRNGVALFRQARARVDGACDATKKNLSLEGKKKLTCFMLYPKNGPGIGIYRRPPAPTDSGPTAVDAGELDLDSVGLKMLMTSDSNRHRLGRNGVGGGNGMG